MLFSSSIFENTVLVNRVIEYVWGYLDVPLVHGSVLSSSESDQMPLWPIYEK